ncbi:MAG: biotin--[acetyl-CoA-carboxylase] ligase [Coriobacteriales bacterium]|jgi:BirA family biotin operon repressor/biotin-[acetyl-CoA-carboxylase] ligase|nr:biotin--[acetyl-CoA-carboxylase] ligase [Coriobacteriales bacterium]
MQHPSISICYLNSVDSTNDYCKRLLAKDGVLKCAQKNAQDTVQTRAENFSQNNADEFVRTTEAIKLPFAVVALEQTKGRGRLGRKWHSPPGGAYISLALMVNHPNENPDALAAVSPLSALAVCKALEKYRCASVKWPNDVVCANEKLAGILVERIGTVKNDSAIIVIGVGVNVVDTNFADLKLTSKDKIQLSPTFVTNGQQPTGFNNPNRQSNENNLNNLIYELSETIIASLHDHICEWQENGHLFSRFISDYKAKLVTLGQDVIVRNALGEVIASGKAIDVGANGELVLRSGDVVSKVATGEVTLRDIA